MRPGYNDNEIEKLKDEFWDWWFERFKQSTYMPSIFEWIYLKLKKKSEPPLTK